MILLLFLILSTAGNNSRSSDIVWPNFENVRPISHYDQTRWPNMSPAHLEFSSSRCCQSINYVQSNLSNVWPKGRFERTCVLWIKKNYFQHCFLSQDGHLLMRFTQSNSRSLVLQCTCQEKLLVGTKELTEAMIHYEIIFCKSKMYYFNNLSWLLSLFKLKYDSKLPITSSILDHALLSCVLDTVMSAEEENYFQYLTYYHTVVQYLGK